MRDRDIRSVLKDSVENLHKDEPDTLILDEMGLYGGMVRVDVTAINGVMHGYEIKSDKDSLDRLENQAEIYSEILDRATLVVGERHHTKATEMIPDWWGITLATRTDEGLVELHEVRPHQENPAVDAFAVASMLWRDEALQLLESAGAARGARSKPREFLYRRLAEVLDLAELQALVRQQLKVRFQQRLWLNPERQQVEQRRSAEHQTTALSPLEYDDWLRTLAKSLVVPGRPDS